jgi:hypothetical protein
MLEQDFKKQDFKNYVIELAQKIPKISKEEFIKQVTIKYIMLCKDDETREKFQNILVDVLKDVTIHNMQFPQ